MRVTNDKWFCLELFPGPVHVVDGHGKILFVNKNWQLIYDLKKSEVIGKYISEILEPYNLKFFLKVDRTGVNTEGHDGEITKLDEDYKQSVALKAIKEKEIVSLFTYNYKGNKNLITSTPYLDDKGNVEFVITYVQDFTESDSIKSRLEKEIIKSDIRGQRLEYYKKEDKTLLIGESKNIKEIKRLVANIAKTDATVLILGENGVGKGVLANYIHNSSNRNKEELIKVNLAAIPDNLLESELFGHEKGAYTGADKTKVGMFELANGGSILLDEIGELPLNLQPKLLHVLQERKFMRVGGVKPISVDTRIIASTNRDLYKLMNQGKFREDLFYRLNIVPITILPLRDRVDDIPILANEFLDKLNNRYNKNKSIKDDAMDLFKKYNWPGNVRELENLLERLVIIDNQRYITSKQVINILNLNEILDDIDINTEESFKTSVEKYERYLIKNALDKYKSTYKAADFLKMTQSSLFRKAQKLGITSRKKEEDTVNENLH